MTITTPRVRTTAPAELAPSSALVVRDLRTSFTVAGRRVEVVRGVDLDLRPGRTLVLLGESGSGKSVTARSVLRLLGDAAHIEGQVLLGDTDLLALPAREMRSLLGRRLALVPQDPAAALNPLRRVGAQITEVLRYHRVVTDRRQAAGRAEELLARVGIPNPSRVARSFAHEMSGGMRQRVAIALAIACEPDVIVADEPTTALDVTVQAQILDLFEELQDRLGTALLLVTHDVGVAERMADEVAVMYAGRIVERGTVQQVLDHPGHPYTRALMEAMPRPGRARGTLASIPGHPPLPSALPSGCAFSPRCSHALDVCRTREPALLDIGGGQLSACVRTGELVGQVTR
jgi:oligopeptide/dipeptide ABC transporter ATP-binding protein